MLLFCGCSNQGSPVQWGEPKQAMFPFDMNSKNIALLFTMTDESGRRENLDRMESIFEDGSLGFEHQTYHNISSPDIYAKLTEVAPNVGKYGTLMLYFNSHGGGSGSSFGMMAKGGSFKFSKALEAIAESNKVKRLIILIDTCHASGGIQEGGFGKEKLINPQTGLPEMEWFYGDNSAYQECLVIASSSVEDLSTRGYFAARLKSAFESSKDDKSITIAEFMRSFAALHSNTRQKPHYKALPDEVFLDEPLFENPLPRGIPIRDRNGPQGEYPPDYIPIPR